MNVNLENTEPPAKLPELLETTKQPLGLAEHLELTAQDCEAIAGMLTKLAVAVRGGDMGAFDGFWLEGGTEEGDAKIREIRERLILRYLLRQERVQRTASAALKASKKGAGEPSPAS